MLLGIGGQLTIRLTTIFSVIGCNLILVSCTTDGIVINASVAEYTFVTTGSSHACGLTEVGDAACWSTDDPRPRIVSQGLNLTSLSTMTGHTCGVASDGRAFCWGFNTFGQLGDSTTTSFCTRPGLSQTFLCSPAPVEVTGGISFASVEVGTSHTCGLSGEGFAYCWGANAVEQLGAISDVVCALDLIEGGLPCSPAPLPVEGGHRFQSLSVGSAHTCGIDDLGEAYCWGSGFFGRLGNGGLENSRTPVLVAGNHRFQSISAGGAHTCGLTISGSAYCWGSNSDMQLGSRDTDNMLSCGVLPFRCLPIPTLVLDEHTFTAVTTSDGVPFGGGGPSVGGHTCGLTEDSTVFCWGLNEFGAVGLNDGRLRIPEPVEFNSDSRFNQLSAGRYNTCGVTAERAVECWAFGSPWAQWLVPVTR